MPLTAYLDASARFRDERDKNVWAALLGSFHAIHRVLDAANRPGFEALVRDRVGPALADLGWTPRPGEEELRAQLRGELIRALGILGNHPLVQARAAEVYARAETVDANVLAAVIPVLAFTGENQRYEEFTSRFRAAQTPQEEQRYLHALPAFRPPPLVEQTLTRTLNGEIRTQDAPLILRTLLTSVHGRELAWSFVKMNWDVMNRLYPTVGVRRMMEGIVGLATPELERDVLRFVRDRQIDLGGKVLPQYLEQLRIAVSLREREEKALSKFLTT
jgi:puromycin-sensitive aminopeptidase